MLQAAETRDRLARNKVDLFIGAAELVPEHQSISGSLTVRVCKANGCVEIPTKKACRQSHVSISITARIKFHHCSNTITLPVGSCMEGMQCVEGGGACSACQFSLAPSHSSNAVLCAITKLCTEDMALRGKVLSYQLTINSK